MANDLPELKMSEIDKIEAEVLTPQGAGQATKEVNKRVIETFRANGGELTGELKGSHVLLVTMIGSKSGKERTSPLGYVTFEGRLFIVASRGGADENPVWYNNIKANPLVTVEYKAETFPAIATELEGAERDRIWEIAKQQIASFAEYETRTTRVIPVIELCRQS